MKPIFLIGFMGCGKSTLGRALANKLNCQFIDLDKRIEEQIGMSLTTYIKQYGEEAFRTKEYHTLSHLFDFDHGSQQKIVVAVGGGAACYFDAIHWMNAKGKTIYLSLSVAALANRLKHAKSSRFLIEKIKHDSEALQNFITQKLAEREVHYKKANLIIDAKNLTAEKLTFYLKELFPEFFS